SWQDSQCPADVKTPVVMRLRLAVEQNSGDEKSREDEEQIYAGPAAKARHDEQSSRAFELRPHQSRVIESVEKQNEQDRNPAERVQLRHHRAYQFFGGRSCGKTHLGLPNVDVRRFPCQSIQSAV